MDDHYIKVTFLAIFEKMPKLKAFLDRIRMSGNTFFAIYSH
jgi:FMN-dependent NADH-azoreductase